MRHVLRNVFFAGGLAAVCLSSTLHAAPAASTIAEAAMRGDAEVVASMLKSGADVSAAQADGMTGLHWAALRNDAALATTLLRAGANANATTRLGGYTPLLLAAKNGSVKVIVELVAAGADPNRATEYGTTPLMLAAASGEPEGVTALLDRGAEVDAKESRGQTALMFAAAAGRTEAIRVLTARGANTKLAMNAVDLTATAQALQEPAGATSGKNLRENDAAAAKLQTDAAARPPRRKAINPYNELVAAQGGLTPLLFAARQGHLDAAKALLDAGADLNQASTGDRTTPLLMATINGHFDLAKALLDRGAAPTATSENGVTALFAALNCQWAPRAAYPQPRAYLQQHTTYLDLMTALIDKGAPVDARVLKKPWYSGYNFDRSGIDEAGATPFWRAAYAGDVDAMRLLVSRGADPNISTMKMPRRAGSADATQRAGGAIASPLPPVIVGGPDVSPLLAAAGIGYTVGYAGNSHVYSLNGMLPAVKYMVDELHMDVKTVDATGNTAIHLAAARGDNEMIEFLLSKGADPLAVNREGLTTVDMANAPVQKTTPFPDTIALLEKLGAKNHHRCMSC